MRWYPMLSKAGDPSILDNDNYIFEQKLDGIRCLVYVENNAILLLSRSGKPLDKSFPDVVQSLQGLAELGPMVLDGEIIPERSGYTFQNLQTRLQRISNIDHAIDMCPASFVAFDILEDTSGFSLMDMPYTVRRKALWNVFINTNCLNVSDNLSPEQAKAILDDPTKEGIVAKLKSGEYYPGTRSGVWLKVKSVKTAELIVGGCTFGIGRRMFQAGSLLLGEETADGLAYVGNVGTGFTDEMLEDICKLIEVFKQEESPFLDWPATETDSNLVKSYCKPGKIRVVVNYQERTRNNFLRFPSLKSIKVDSEAKL